MLCDTAGLVFSILVLPFDWCVLLCQGVSRYNTSLTIGTWTKATNRMTGNGKFPSRYKRMAVVLWALAKSIYMKPHIYDRKGSLKGKQLRHLYSIGRWKREGIASYKSVVAGQSYWLPSSSVNWQKELRRLQWFTDYCSQAQDTSSLYETN